MIRVLNIITTSMVPFGGLTTVSMNYFRAIDKKNFEIDFAASNQIDQQLLVELHANNSEYHKLPQRKDLVLYVYKLYKICKKYDVVHIHANSATAVIELLAAMIAGVSKRIVHIHTSSCDHKIAHTILYPLFKLLYTDAIAVSKKAGDWIFKDYKVLRNGINTAKYAFSNEDRIRVRKEYNIPYNAIVLGHVGKIYKPKNHEFLIDVFKKYSETHNNTYLLLVGDGDLRKSIQEKVNSLDLNDKVVFTGMQTPISEFLSAMDIFVFPSLWEGMPLSLIEAQASGLKCISSNTIDSNSNVTGEVVRLPINDVNLWVDAIHNIYLEDRQATCEKYIDLIKKNCFDIYSNALILERIYKGK